MSAKVTQLANGLRVASDRMEGFRTAAIAVHVLVGGRHELASQNGTAHFLEHMAFKGTKRRSAIQISETIEHVGGYLNAATGKEATSYYVGGLGENAPLALDLLSDIILNSTMEPEDIELERGVILNEIGEYEDSPTDSLFEALQRTSYPDQPFGRPIIGTADLVSSIGRSDIREFVTEHYVPGRMILTAAGDVDHDQLVDMAAGLFDQSDPGSDFRPEQCRFSGGEHRESRDIEQAHFALAFEAPAVRDPQDAAARVFAVALGGGASSRLFVEARERRGLCYSISAHAVPYSDTGTLTIHASTGRDEIKELANLCIDEIRKSPDVLTEDEITKARNQIRVAILTGNENPMHRSERMGALLSILGRLEDIDETMARYDAVSLEDVREFAASITRKDEAAMAVLGQVDKAPSVGSLMERLAE